MKNKKVNILIHIIVTIFLLSWLEFLVFTIDKEPSFLQLVITVLLFDIWIDFDEISKKLYNIIRR